MAATRSLNTDARKKKKQVPFYDIPSCDTPAKIIADARRSVRPVGTERPYTPADNRNLFGGSASQSRPPSSFSIGARHFSDERSSRPATRQRLAPIERSVVEDPTVPTRKVVMVLYKKHRMHYGSVVERIGLLLMPLSLFSVGEIQVIIIILTIFLLPFHS